MKKDLQRKPPVKEGDVVEVHVEAIGEKGDGICRYKGYIVFVPKVSQGDTLKVRLTKTLPKVGFGEVVEKLEEAKPQKVNTPEDSTEFGEDIEAPEEEDEDFDMTLPGEEAKK